MDRGAPDSQEQRAGALTAGARPERQGLAPRRSTGCRPPDRPIARARRFGRMDPCFVALRHGALRDLPILAGRMSRNKVDP
jgi:hypothetical protein